MVHTCPSHSHPASSYSSSLAKIAQWASQEPALGSSGNVAVLDPSTAAASWPSWPHPWPEAVAPTASFTEVSLQPTFRLVSGHFSCRPYSRLAGGSVPTATQRRRLGQRTPRMSYDFICNSGFHALASPQPPPSLLHCDRAGASRSTTMLPFHGLIRGSGPTVILWDRPRNKHSSAAACARQGPHSPPAVSSTGNGLLLTTALSITTTAAVALRNRPQHRAHGRPAISSHDGEGTLPPLSVVLLPPPSR